MPQAPLRGKKQLAAQTRMAGAGHRFGLAFRLPICAFARHGLMSGYIQSVLQKKNSRQKKFRRLKLDNL
jgi:hypothetical protein